MEYNKINIKSLKARLTLGDYETIINKLNIPFYSKGKTEWRLYTGDKYKNALEGSPKLFMYPDTKVFISYTAARSYDIISLTQTRLALLNGKCSFIEAVNFILDVTGIEKGLVTRQNTSKQNYDWEQDFGKFIRFKNGVSDLPTFDDSILPSLSTSIPQQWLDEGISVDTMQKYQIGYYERLNCTTIPCFNREGQLIGIRTRNWQPDMIEDKGKYYPLYLLDGTNYAFPTNNVFYGINFNWPEIERTKTCFLGESEKFVLKLDSWFGRNSTALAMYGNNLGITRRNQLLKMGVERVIYVPDNDFEEYDTEQYKEWVDKVNRFTGLFKGYCQVEVVWDNDPDNRLLGYKDNASDRDKATWDKLYEAREIIE